jgi:hypothetical protein
MIVSRIDNPAWPKDTYLIEHNNVSMHIIPVVDGLEIDTNSKFHVDWNPSNEQFEITFFEFHYLDTTCR